MAVLTDIRNKKGAAQDLDMRLLFRIVLVYFRKMCIRMKEKIVRGGEGV